MVRVILAILVGVVVAVAFAVIGDAFLLVANPLAQFAGRTLKGLSILAGIVACVWYFFKGTWPPR